MTAVPLLCCVDVDYRGDVAVAAAILFLDWGSEVPVAQHVVTVRGVAPYRPGAFFERELPCIQEVLARNHWPLAAIVVDGYAWLGDQQPGLGARLFAALGEQVPVIGVAKTEFVGAPAVQVLRGDSKKPLFVSAAGMPATTAAGCVLRMHGAHRLPTILKEVDRLCRERDER
jgi:deoxyribonuclease V